MAYTSSTTSDAASSVNVVGRRHPNFIKSPYQEPEQLQRGRRRRWVQQLLAFLALSVVVSLLLLILLLPYFLFFPYKS